jgi:hypothetical protein
MNYQVITAYSPEKLAQKVDGLLDEGWEPQGGVSVSAWTDNHIPKDEHWELFAQAMIRPEHARLTAKRPPAKLAARQ